VGPGAVILLLEIVAHPLLEISGFAYVDHLALVVCKDIATGIVGKRVQRDHVINVKLSDNFRS
jgi:hypothetical protein